MNLHARTRAAPLAMLAVALTCRASAVEEHTFVCAKSATFLAPLDSPAHRKYAPDREIDIRHLALDVTPDFQARTVSGKATMRFRPIATPLHELKLDAVDLDVQSVESSEKVRAFQVAGDKITVTFETPVPPDREASVTITYQAEPSRGLYFRTPEMGYKPGETHLFTQGESIEARHWYPCFDAPNEKFTSEITCRVPAGMTVLSNGRKMSESTDPSSGLLTVRWLQDKPHVTYLMTLVAGYFKKVEDRYRDTPLAFWTLPSEIDQAMNSFRDTKDMMAFFEQEIGVPYPWAKYDQVCVNDFVAGGMENTTQTTLTDGTLFSAATENIRSSQGLVAHELVHQWFGNLVTCKDWSQLWLNEGFATYYEALYDRYKNGRDAFHYNLYQDAKTVLAQADETPIVWRQFDSPGEQFGYRAYPKGAWVLHMLRSQLGEDLFRRCIRTYLERHQFDTVVTEDLSSIVEELSGRSFDRFFDQWVYHARQPELAINYAWDERSRLAKLSVRQTQKLSDAVLLFEFPLTLRFHTASGPIDREVRIRELSGDFYFPLPEAPRIVRVDPEFTLLAKIAFTPPTPLLHAQLTNRDDMIGRLLAVEQLGTRKDRDSIARLRKVLDSDPFHGVRSAAARALQSIHTDEALEALLASVPQPDARVRLAVVEAVAGFYRPAAFDATLKTLETEKNPAILREAIRGLGAWSKLEVRDRLTRYLDSESYRNELADAAVDAIRIQDDPACLAPLLRVLREHEARFTSDGLADGLQAAAFLARHETNRTPVREFLLERVNHPRRRVQLAAIGALGTLGDPKAIGPLEKFTTARRESPQRQAAERAIATLRSTARPAESLGSVRNEMLKLQQQNQELRQEMEDLKKRFEALDSRPAEKPNAPAPKRKSSR